MVESSEATELSKYLDLSLGRPGRRTISCSSRHPAQWDLVRHTFFARLYAKIKMGQSSLTRPQSISHWPWSKTTHWTYAGIWQRRKRHRSRDLCTRKSHLCWNWLLWRSANWTSHFQLSRTMATCHLHSQQEHVIYSTRFRQANCSGHACYCIMRVAKESQNGC